MGRALIRVLTSNDSPRIFANAKTLAAQLGPQEGRVVACERIIEVIKAQKKDEDKKDKPQKDQTELIRRATADSRKRGENPRTGDRAGNSERPVLEEAIQLCMVP